MVSRIVLSLKQATDLRQNSWSLVGPTVNGTGFRSTKFFQPAKGANGKKGDNVPLDAFLESWRAIRSKLTLRWLQMVLFDYPWLIRTPGYWAQE